MISTNTNIYDELLNGIPDNNREEVRMVLYKFIINELSYEEAKDQMLKYESNIEVLNNLMTVFDVPDHPLNGKRYSSGSYIEKKMNTWTQAEDQRLLAAIHRYGISDWSKISLFVGRNRNRNQCSQRWLRSLNPLINKTPWSMLEDHQLLDAVEKFGTKCWTKVSSELEGRTDVQCRYRYQILVRRNQGNIEQYKNKLRTELSEYNSDSVDDATQIMEPKNISTETLHDVQKVDIDDSRMINLMNMIKEVVSDPSSVFNFVD